MRDSVELGCERREGRPRQVAGSREAIELALERLAVAAKGSDDLAPYVRAARAAGAPADAVAATLRRVRGRSVDRALLDLARAPAYPRPTAQPHMREEP
ncbi:MAG: hypothetical protein D6689_19735 [Deltaproteobacteria bacterium]|nr:MAG: hypothetical protein D6689_19735 [Deltaproteobacteria bacterium]